MGLKIGSGLKTVRNVKMKVVFEYKLPNYPIPDSSPAWYGQPIASTDNGFVIKDTNTKVLASEGDMLPDSTDVFFSDDTTIT